MSKTLLIVTVSFFIQIALGKIIYFFRKGFFEMTRFFMWQCVWPCNCKKKLQILLNVQNILHYCVKIPILYKKLVHPNNYTPIRTQVLRMLPKYIYGPFILTKYFCGVFTYLILLTLKKMPLEAWYKYVLQFSFNKNVCKIYLKVIFIISLTHWTFSRSLISIY